MQGRRHSRRAVTCQARIVVQAGGSHDCVVQDVSESGARLLLSEPSPIPSNFTLSFGRDRDVTVSLRWQNGKEIGVAFER